MQSDAKHAENYRSTVQLVMSTKMIHIVPTQNDYGNFHLKVVSAIQAQT